MGISLLKTSEARGDCNTRVNRQGRSLRAVQICGFEPSPPGSRTRSRGIPCGNRCRGRSRALPTPPPATCRCAASGGRRPSARCLCGLPAVRARHCTEGGDAHQSPRGGTPLLLTSRCLLPREGNEPFRFREIFALRIEDADVALFRVMRVQPKMGGHEAFGLRFKRPRNFPRASQSR